jgi:hypothetical protein
MSPTPTWGLAIIELAASMAIAANAVIGVLSIFSLLAFGLLPVI